MNNGTAELGDSLQAVSGLDKDNFQVYEDGVLQTIKYFSHEDIPVTVGLVVAITVEAWVRSAPT